MKERMYFMLLMIAFSTCEYAEESSNPICDPPCVNGQCVLEDSQPKCKCNRGWTWSDCSINCSCVNSSYCQKGCPQCDGIAKVNCHLCRPGTYGNATIGCKSCTCNGRGNADLNYCHPVTGQCYCLFGTQGHNCEKCKPDFYGDPREGRHCYQDCKSRIVLTSITKGSFGSLANSNPSLSNYHCLWIITVFPTINANNIDSFSNQFLQFNNSYSIVLTIYRDLKVDCLFNHIEVFDGLPDYIAPGRLKSNLGSYCGYNLESNIELVAYSGYLVVHFNRKDSSQGFNASYYTHKCPSNCVGYLNSSCDDEICLHKFHDYSLKACPDGCFSSLNRGRCDKSSGRCDCKEKFVQPNCKKQVNIDKNIIWTTLFESKLASNNDNILENEKIPRMGHSLEIINNLIWVFGGYSTSQGSLNDILTFNLSTSKWQRLIVIQKKPAPRHFHATVLFKDCIYIHGGLSKTKVLNDFWLFNTTELKWYQLVVRSDIPPLAGHTLTLISSNYLLLMGGFSPDYGFLDKIFAYNINNQIWEQLNTSGNMPLGFYGHSSVYHWMSDTIYIFGGYMYLFDRTFVSSSLYALKISTMTWSLIPFEEKLNPFLKRPSYRYFHAAATTDNYMIVVGGRSGNKSGEILKDAYIYVYKYNHWINLFNQEYVISYGIPYLPSIGLKMVFDLGVQNQGYGYIFGGFNALTLGRLTRFSIPKDICNLFSKTRHACISHVGCLFCSLHYGEANETFCFSDGEIPLICRNPLSNIESWSGSRHRNWYTFRECEQYENCLDCLESARKNGLFCEWCINCPDKKCVADNSTCKYDCYSRYLINHANLCPHQSCLASDCNKCTALDVGCIWTRQVVRTIDGHTLNVRPIFDWTCVSKTVKNNSSFHIESMPPLSCPPKCSFHSGCRECLKSVGGEGGWQSCIWSEKMAECISPSYVKLRCEGGNCGEDLLVPNQFSDYEKMCEIECESFKQASHCLRMPHCGWCSFDNKINDGQGLCMRGGLLGPNKGFCNSTVFSDEDSMIRWHYLKGPKEDECRNGHHDCNESYEQCFDLEEGFKCVCKEGFKKINNECKPICKGGCIHGDCIKPNVCQCKFGYTGANCSFQCKCNGHSNCAGEHKLDECLECFNNTYGKQCEFCKPFYVGNPLNGGKCVSCFIYCNEHSQICLTPELLNKSNVIDWSVAKNLDYVKHGIAWSGSKTDVTCINCLHNTTGERCEKCLHGYFKIGESIVEGCRACECNGHGNTCDEYGDNCQCGNNTETERPCGKNSKNGIACWQSQCIKCKDSYAGTPIDGHQCYKQMFIDREYCFNPDSSEQCDDENNLLNEGQVVFFAVLPRYMNVDIRIVVDVSVGKLDFYFSFKDDTFVVNTNQNEHNIWLDSKYDLILSSAFSSDLGLFQNITQGFSDVGFTSTRGSYFRVRHYEIQKLTTHVLLNDPNELLVIRELSHRLVITIPQQLHDLRSTRFYIVLKGVDNSSYGVLSFRQDQSRIDLFVFFTVFFSCFFLFFAFCVLAWKVKQALELRQARRLHAAEVRHMASRPFSSTLVYLDPNSSIDNFEYALSSPLHKFHSKKCKKELKLKASHLSLKDSPKFLINCEPDPHLIRPIGIEPLSNGSAAVITTLVVLPGNQNTCVRMSLATALVSLRGSSLIIHQESSSKWNMTK